MAVQNEPLVYVHKYGVEAMEVKRPFKAVAEWCGGELVKDGVKFDHILIRHHGQNFHAHEGNLVVKVFPDKDEFVVWKAPLFNKMFKLAKGQ